MRKEELILVVPLDKAFGPGWSNAARRSAVLARWGRRLGHVSGEAGWKERLSGHFAGSTFKGLEELANFFKNKGMTKEEGRTLGLFMGPEHYGTVNAVLRGRPTGVPKENELRVKTQALGYAKDLDRVLSLLPNHQGTVYRGVPSHFTNSEGQKWHQMETGAIHHEKGFLSASEDPRVGPAGYHLDEYANKYEDNPTTLRIKAKTAKRVRDEYVFRPGAKFKKTDQERVPFEGSWSNHRHVVDLEEI